MGWTGGNHVFEGVADQVLDSSATLPEKVEILACLIGALQLCDWDTECESLGDYRDEPLVVAAFRQCNVELDEDDLEDEDE